MPHAMLIAGTKDSRTLIKILTNAGINLLATVTTPYGAELIEKTPKVAINTGKLDIPAMRAIIKEGEIKCVIDASHPYAAEVSQNAITTCKALNLPYIRFERNEAAANYPDIIRTNNYDEAAKSADSIEGNIFLTTGSKNLEAFIKNTTNYKSRLFTRVLPESTVLKECETLGLTAGNIIAVKGPFTEEMNKQMLIHTSAKVIVMKNSGDYGGTPEKIKAAAGLGIPVILIERPKLDYPYKTGSMEEILEKTLVLIKGGRV